VRIKPSVGIAFGIGVLLGLIVGGIFSRSNDGTPIQNSDRHYSGRFHMNVVVSGVPFWTEARNSWSELPKLYPGIETVFGGPANTDSQRQAEEIDTLVAAGNVDGIILYPGDSKALTASIDKAAAKGIPVITFLTDCPESKRLTYITSDLEPAGQRVASYALSQKPLVGKSLILLGQVGNDEQEARSRGIEMAITRNPNLTIMTRVEDRFDEAVGAEALKPLLAQNKDIVFIAGCNSRSAVAAVQALKELGYKPGDVTVSGWDFDNQVLDLIEEGWVTCSVAQNSEAMTYIAFNILRSIKSGEFEKFGKGSLSNLPSQIIVPVELITKVNTASYRRN
jgi:ribose transport system substrate-binding protein